MKRFLTRSFRRATARGFMRATAALATVALLGALLPVQAFAGQWKTVEIKWHLTSVGSPTNATAIYQRDTTYTTVGVSTGQAADTTGNFSASDADPFRGGHSGAATSVDTVLAGFLVLQSDTSVAVTNTVSSITVEVDGRMGGFGPTINNNNWVQVDSLVASPISNNDGTNGATNLVIVPLRALSALGGIGGNVATTGNVNNGYKFFACQELRIRISTVTGILPMARAFFRYWDDDAQP